MPLNQPPLRRRWMSSCLAALQTGQRQSGAYLKNDLFTRSSSIPRVRRKARSRGSRRTGLHIRSSLSGSSAASSCHPRLIPIRALPSQMPKLRQSDQTGGIGEKTVDLVFSREFGWSYHQFGNKRAGIDGEVEIVGDGDELSGRLLAVQVRTGASYFARTTADGIIYEGNKDELEYWLRYSLP